MTGAEKLGPLRGWAAMTGAIVLWAGAFPAITLGLKSFDPVNLAALRFAIAAAILGAILGLTKNLRLTIDRHDLAIALASGALGIACYNIFLNMGQLHVAAGTASFLVAIQPIFSALFAKLINKEKQSPWLWVGCATALGGVGLIVLGGDAPSFEAGCLFVLVAAAFSGLSFVFQGRLVARQGAAKSTILVLLSGAFCLSPFLPSAIGQAAQADAIALAAAFYLAAGAGVVGYFAWLEAIAHFGSTRAAVFLFLMAPVAAFMESLITHRPPALTTLIGGGIALFGVYVCQRSRGNPGRVDSAG